MTPEEKIAGAAELIVSETLRRGTPTSLYEATQIAKTLYRFWTERVQVRDLKPGEIAQRFRDRYDDRGTGGRQTGE